MSDAKKQPKPDGRPTKFKPEYCQMLIDHMSSGLSFETFGASIDIARSTIFEWCDDHPEFSDAKKKAFDKCQMFWEKIGVDNIIDVTSRTGNHSETRSLNTGAWIFNMKNRFKWADKVELSGGDNAKPILLAYDSSKLLPNEQ